MTCAHCGAAFESPTGWPRKYCSPKCKNAGGGVLRKARNAASRERRCYSCHEVKPATEFASATKTYCRPCDRTYTKAWAAENRPRLAEYKRRATAKAAAADPDFYRKLTLGKFGLSLDEFEALLERQDGRCAICRTEEPGGRHHTWHVDHDHSCCAYGRSCGKCVRGLLCQTCNIGLGHFKDDEALLEAALEYLRRQKSA